MISSGTETKGFAVGPFVACPRCAASVKFPAKYCDMCGGQLAQDAVLDFVLIPEPPAQRQEDGPQRLGDTVAGRDDSAIEPRRRREDQPPAPAALQTYTRPRLDSDAARRSLRAAYVLLKGNQQSLESMERSANPESLGGALLRRIAAHVRMRPEIAELHRTLDLVVNEGRKASDLDPEAIIETEDGPMNASALLSRADRTRGHIELYAGTPRKAISHYLSSIGQLETQDAYFDLAVAYERTGQPGKALRAYEACGEIAPDSELGIDALENAEDLRSQMVLGGWFLGSRIIVTVLGVCALSGLVIMPMIPLAGLLNFALWGATLCVYCLANFRLRGTSGARDAFPSSDYSQKSL